MAPQHTPPSTRRVQPTPVRRKPSQRAQCESLSRSKKATRKTSPRAPRALAPFSKRPSLPRLKNRRDLFGGLRGQGHSTRQPLTRPDPDAFHYGPVDPSESSCGGLPAFGQFLQCEGVDQALRDICKPLKTGRRVRYSMVGQTRLLLDLFVTGAVRIFDLERCAHDPLLLEAAGGAVCALDTLYRDVNRFTPQSVESLEALLAQQGLKGLRQLNLPRVHLDIDSTVLPLEGTEIEGACKGYNPEKRGHPSYHPIVARVAEADRFIGAKLRPGNTTFGAAEAPLVSAWVRRIRKELGPKTLLYVRIDKAGHCGQILQAIAQAEAFFLVKGRLDTEIQRALANVAWETTDEDAEEQPLEQVAEVRWTCPEWETLGLPPVRLIAVRSLKRQGGKKLWPEQDWTVQVLLTNDELSEAACLVEQYDERAGIEPLIGEAKQSWGLGQVSSKSFLGNEAMLMLKLLSHNLLRRMAQRLAPQQAHRWNSSWLRSLLINRPARLVRTGRKRIVRLGPGPALVQLE